MNAGISASFPRLIINADDLGIHPSINAGIKTSFERGGITSSTLLTTAEFAESAVREVVKPTGLPTGIHLSLTMGKARANPNQISRLVTPEGVLRFSAGGLIMALQLQRPDPQILREIRHELVAQLSFAFDLGIPITHFDGHQHIHMIPAVFEIMKEIAPRFGLKKCRFVREKLLYSSLWIRTLRVCAELNPIKFALLNFNARKIRSDFASPDGFFGVMYAGIWNFRAMNAALAQLRGGKTYEIGIHPGFRAEAVEELPYDGTFKRFIGSLDRAQELELVLSPQVATRIKETCHLISYGDL